MSRPFIPLATLQKELFTDIEQRILRTGEALYILLLFVEQYTLNLMFKNISYRLWQEFLMPDRIADLKNEIDHLKANGYNFLSIHDYYSKVKFDGRLSGKWCVVRIDVDSDPEYCRSFAKVLLKSDIPASFYFRLSTLDKDIMEFLHQQGFEVGYHYEELATFAKRMRLKNPQAVLDRIEEPRFEFKQNFRFFTEYFGHKTTTVASHGDFANRKLKLTNYLLVNDAVKSDLGIEFEVYDKSIMQSFDEVLIDAAPPAYWRPQPPSSTCKSDDIADHSIRVIIHPRQWRSNVFWNIRSDFARLWEGILFAI